MNRFRPRLAVAVAAASALALIAAGSGGASKNAPARAHAGVVFVSSQLNTVTETATFNSLILKGFSAGADFVPITGDNLAARIRAESQAGRGSISLVGDTESNYPFYKSALANLTSFAGQLKGSGVSIPASLMNLGKLGGSTQLFIPWVQATYIMIANKKALPYLPKGANVKDLTYGQFIQWAKNLAQKFGRQVVGFPAGPSGLMLRFLHGYLLPSFSGGVVTTWNAPLSKAAWSYLAQLWKYVNPQSFQYQNMSDPMLSGEVLVGWDHVVRLTPALKAHPEDFVTFPVPRGPKGRAYLPVVVGLGVPKTAPNAADARSLIRYLLAIGNEAKMLGGLGWFPVVTGKLSEKLGPGLLKMVGTVKRLQTDKRAIVSGLPVALGTQGGAFTKIFQDTLRRVVVNRENIGNVLDDEGKQLQQVFTSTGAPCFRPDPASSGACQVGG